MAKTADADRPKRRFKPLPEDRVKDIRRRKRHYRVTWRQVGAHCGRSPEYVRNVLTGHDPGYPAIVAAFDRLCPPIPDGGGEP